MKLFVFILSFMAVTPLFGQWTGEYLGTINGDNVRMKLTQNGSMISGELTDSQQAYNLLGSIQGDDFTGTATEKTYQLNFGLNAHKQGEMLECVLVVEMNGQRNEVPFLMQKRGSQDAHVSSTTTIPFPQEASFPSHLVGTWSQHETYNSGSGDNFMGANFSQSMTFHSDGTLSEGTTNASMSGTNYSGQSTKEGSGKLEGIGWYTVQNNFYLLVFHEEKWVPIHVGTWYMENNHLLITGNQGEKLLLSR